MSVDVLWSGPEGGPVVVLAHGAGAAMDSAWMETFAGLLAARGVRVARFEFAYMAARRPGPDGAPGARKPPPRAESVMGEYRAVVAQLRATMGSGVPLVIGGKSMGGRVASMVAEELFEAGSVQGLVCLGYPFHPPGSPAKLRTAHLESLRVPTLIVQGTRDPFGTIDEVPGYALAPSIRLLWLDDGEHEFKPRVKISGHTHAEHLATAADAVAAFIRGL